MLKKTIIYLNKKFLSKIKFKTKLIFFFFVNLKKLKQFFCVWDFGNFKVFCLSKFYLFLLMIYNTLHFNLIVCVILFNEFSFNFVFLESGVENTFWYRIN